MVSLQNFVSLLWINPLLKKNIHELLTSPKEENTNYSRLVMGAN